MPTEFESLKGQGGNHAAEGKELTRRGDKCFEPPWRKWRPAARKGKGAG